MPPPSGPFIRCFRSRAAAGRAGTPRGAEREDGEEFRRVQRNTPKGRQSTRWKDSIHYLNVLQAAWLLEVEFGLT